MTFGYAGGNVAPTVAAATAATAACTVQLDRDFTDPHRHTAPPPSRGATASPRR